MKNLVYFARVLKDVKQSDGADLKKNDDNNDDGDGHTVSLQFLVRRMRRIVNMEIAKTPGSHTLVSIQNVSS